MWVYFIIVLAKTLSLMPMYPSLWNEEVRAIVVRANYGYGWLFFMRESVFRICNDNQQLFPKVRPKLGFSFALRMEAYLAVA